MSSGPGGAVVTHRSVTFAPVTATKAAHEGQNAPIGRINGNGAEPAVPPCSARPRKGRPTKAVPSMAISDITEQTKTRIGASCTVCDALKNLPTPEATALQSLLEDPTWRYTRLSEELHREGVELAAHVLSRHARGACAARTKLR